VAGRLNDSTTPEPDEPDTIDDPLDAALPQLRPVAPATTDWRAAEAERAGRVLYHAFQRALRVEFGGADGGYAPPRWSGGGNELTERERTVWRAGAAALCSWILWARWRPQDRPPPPEFVELDRDDPPWEVPDRPER